MRVPAAAPPEPNPTLKGHKLLILSPDHPDPAELATLRERFPDLVIATFAVPWAVKVAENVTAADWEDVTILLTGNTLPPTPETAPKLQYVQLLSAGANLILDHPVFKDTDVAFCTANGVHPPQISEWVILTFLAHQHKLPTYLASQGEATWRRDTSPVDDAVGRTVGILGYGSIGRQVARLSVALGATVHAYTLHARTTPESRRDDAYVPAPGLGDVEGALPARWFSGGSTEELHAFLGSGLDLLVVSLPLTAKTTGLLGKKELEVLGKERKAFLSNIARGAVVNTDALVEALEDGVIRGAALDVTDPEPLPDGHRLWKAPNVIITPHISGMSTSYVQRVFGILELNLGRLAEGGPLVNKVSRREGY